MNRTNIIQALINKIDAKKYLEIGVSNGDNFREIKCEYKIGVDPEPESPATIYLPSDEFFAQNKETFDIIFVDGLHEADQVYRDITNSLTVLNAGGYIVCHDMNPIKEEHQLVPFTGGHWNGDCWKAFVQLRTERGDLDMVTVDTDEGCSVIRVKSQDEITEPLVNTLELTYANLEANRQQWLNLTSINDFMLKIGNNLDSLLVDFINNPADCQNNFKLALYYHGIGQCATAVSYYIRTAERTDNKLLQYECLVRASMCFESQGTRRFSVKGMLQHAVALLPNRPEAYFLLSRLHSNESGDGNWFDSYTMASIGLAVTTDDVEPLLTKVDYPGRYALQFQQAHAAWWCGLCDESRNLFIELYNNPQVDPVFKQSIKQNLIRLNVFSTKEIEAYNKDFSKQLRHQFPGSENIEKNYSESYQDMFVLSMLNGKQKGTYLEIGAANPFYGNNTALLETDFEWKGVSLDIEQSFVDMFSTQRKNLCVLRDATTVNYEQFLKGLGYKDTIDYLQIDCDPPEISYRVLLSMPFETYKFAVITFEHDHYTDKDAEYRELSRNYLESYGYKLVANDIAPDEWRTYEDWWIHPDLIDPEILEKMTLVNDNVKKAQDYMLGKL